MPSNVNEKHEQSLILWVIPFLLVLVGFGFVATVAEIFTFMWPGLKLYYYLGFFSVIIIFMGYFNTAKPESYDRNRSRIPELVVLLILSKLYTMLVLPFDVFLSHLRINRFLEVNFAFAFVLLYFVWVLARSAGNLAKTMTHSLIDRELRSQYDESYVGSAERENETGLKLIRYLFIPMVVILILVVGAEQSFQQKMAVATSLRLKVNIFGGIMVASIVAMSTLVLYLRKSHEWAREKAEIEKDLGFKWVIWSLVFVLLFTAVAAFLPDDLSPIYFYVPNAIKALLPFMHKDAPLGPIVNQRYDEELPELPERPEQDFVGHSNALLTTIVASVRVVLFIIVFGVLVYHLFRAFYENSDELKNLVDNIAKTFKFLYDMIRKIFIKITPSKVDRKTLTEQIEQFFRRKKVSYNQVTVNEVRRLYAELLIEAEDKGIRREAYSTASEFAIVLEELFPERVQEIIDVTKMYEEARYNEDPDEVTSRKAKGIFGVVFQAIKSYTRKQN